MKTADETRTELVRDVQNLLAAMSDERIEQIGDVREVSARMAQMVPRTPGKFGKLIGPVYSTQALMNMWGQTRAAVSKRATSGRLLALKVSGENLFPSFQFSGNKVRDDVLSLVEALRRAVDPFTIAQWFKTPLLSDKHARTPLELLDAGEADCALTAAQAAASHWGR